MNAVLDSPPGTLKESSENPSWLILFAGSSLSQTASASCFHLEELDIWQKYFCLEIKLPLSAQEIWCSNQRKNFETFYILKLDENDSKILGKLSDLALNLPFKESASSWTTLFLHNQTGVSPVAWND